MAAHFLLLERRSHWRSAVQLISLAPRSCCCCARLKLSSAGYRTMATVLLSPSQHNNPASFSVAVTGCNLLLLSLRGGCNLALSKIGSFQEIPIPLCLCRPSPTQRHEQPERMDERGTSGTLPFLSFEVFASLLSAFETGNSEEISAGNGPENSSPPVSALSSPRGGERYSPVSGETGKSMSQIRDEALSCNAAAVRR